MSEKADYIAFNVPDHAVAHTNRISLYVEKKSPADPGVIIIKH